MMAASPAFLAVRQFRHRYIIALSLIAMLVIAAQWLIQHSIATAAHDARIINIAGRQRMLSQQITKTSLYLRNEHPAGYERRLAQLGDALALWQRSHNGLLHGDIEMGLPERENSPEIKQLFDSIAPAWAAIVRSANDILQWPHDRTHLQQAIDTIKSHEAHFLRGMDAIVFRYDEEARAHVDFTRRLEIALAALTLLVLALEARFIFAPAVARLRQQMQLQKQHQTDMERLFSANPGALLLLDADTLQVRRVNQKAAALMDCAASELIGCDFSCFLDPAHEANLVLIEKLRAGSDFNEYEVLLINAHSSTINALASTALIHYGEQKSLIIGITNISEIKRAQQTLEYYATFDEMTGLVNRRTGMLMLSHEMNRAHRKERALTICYIDLDGLKIANDEYGHSEGDWMIRTLADALLKAVRKGDVAMRLGGDEFLVILHDCTQQQALALQARVLTHLQAAASDRARGLSASFGFCTYDSKRHRDIEIFINEADEKMYLAKKARAQHAALARHA